MLYIYSVGRVQIQTPLTPSQENNMRKLPTNHCKALLLPVAELDVFILIDCMETIGRLSPAKELRLH